LVGEPQGRGKATMRNKLPRKLATGQENWWRQKIVLSGEGREGRPGFQNGDLRKNTGQGQKHKLGKT